MNFIINCIKKNDGELTTNHEEIANILSDFLKSIYTPKTKNPDIDWEDFDNPNIISDITIDEDSVKKIIKKIKNSNGLDPMGISVNMLKNSLGSTLGFITKLVKKCIEDIEIPDSMKQCVIRFIKKGSKDPTLPPNLRPLCITSIVKKIGERLIKNHVTDSLIYNGFFSEFLRI